MADPDLIERTRALFLRDDNTYGCAEVALVALQEHWSLPDAADSSAAMALNGGVAYSGATCGAITGAAMAVGRLADPTVDVVLGPSDDGGSPLIGMKRVHGALFEAMPWSTPRVLAETERRARAAGLAVARLPAWFDVDTAEDLERLRASLARGEGAPAPATRALLEAWRAAAPA